MSAMHYIISKCIDIVLMCLYLRDMFSVLSATDKHFSIMFSSSTSHVSAHSKKSNKSNYLVSPSAVSSQIKKINRMEMHTYEL